MNNIKNLIKELKDESSFALKVSNTNYLNGDVERSALMYGSFLAKEEIIQKLKLLLKTESRKIGKPLDRNIGNAPVRRSS